MAHHRSFAAALAATALFVGLSATPALAIDGREAVNQCMSEGARMCAFATQADGSIRITTRDGQTLSCASAAAPCAMLYAPRTTQIAEAPRTQTRPQTRTGR